MSGSLESETIDSRLGWALSTPARVDNIQLTKITVCSMGSVSMSFKLDALCNEVPVEWCFHSTPHEFNIIRNRWPAAPIEFDPNIQFQHLNEFHWLKGLWTDGRHAAYVALYPPAGAKP